MPTIEVIANAAGGGFVEDDTDAVLAEAFSKAGVQARITLAEGGEQLVEHALGSDAEILVAGGGDGTVNAVASAVIQQDKTLGVIPLGTLNHFSKDIGMPQELEDAVRALASGRVDRLDLAEVNGKIFLNNSSIGLYPRMVRRRKLQQERLGWGKWYAAFLAAIQVFRRHPFLRVQFEVDGKTFRRKTPFVFVGNNAYTMDLYNIGGRETLRDGKLCVYLLRKGGRWGVIKLVLHTMFGMLKSMEEFETIETDRITIDLRKKRVLVAYDGEVAVMQTPLEYRIRPRELKVIVPAEAAQ